MWHRLKQFAKRKSVIGLCSVLAVTGTVVGAQWNKAPEPTRYVLASVTRGMLIASVTGSGQASGENQVDVKSNVSGSLVRILVKPGDEVKAGTPLFDIDRKVAVKAVRDAAQSVTDAKLSLDSSQISLQKLKQASDDPVSLVQAQNTLNQAKRDLESLKEGPSALDIRQAENELAQAVQNAKISDDGKTPQIVRNAYDNEIPILKSISQSLQQSLYDADSVLGIDNTGLNDAFEHQLSVLNSSKLAEADNGYGGMKISVLALKQETDALKAFGEDPANIEKVLEHSESTINLAETFLQNVQDVLTNTIASITFTQSNLDALRNTIQSDRTNLSSKLSSLTGQSQSLEQAKASYVTAKLNVEKAQTALEKLKQGALPKDIATAEERIVAAEASLAKQKIGTDPLDIAMSENSVAQRRSSLAASQNRLADAYDALNDYTVRAPFDGVVAKVPVHQFDQASPSTALATLLTHAKIAMISLNEVDAAKVKVDQKVTLTFDAVPDLSIAGKVSEVDSIGTVTQGVVNYSVKIAFETQDDRIKTGMSVSASVATDIRTDALLVPNAAVKRNGSGMAVQTLSGADPNSAQADQSVTSRTLPESVPVQTELANDQMTVVTSGLKEGDKVVVRTIDAAALAKVKTTAAASSGIRIPGVSGGGGGGFNAAAGRRPGG